MTPPEEPAVATRPERVRRRKGFFRRIALVQALLVVLSVGTVGSLVLLRAEDAVRRGIEDSLTAQALLIAPYTGDDFALQHQDPEGWRRLEERLHAFSQATHVRVTLIRRDGSPVLDTDSDPASMEDHFNRPEVRAALSVGIGSHERRSRTVGRDLYYLAYVADPGTGGRSGVVRLALDLDRYRDRILAVRNESWLGVAIASLLAISLGLWLVRRVSGPVERMTAVADALSRGDFRARIDHPSGDELGVLADALNHLGLELEQQVATLTADEAQLRAMLAGMAEGVIAVDENDRVTFGNRAARALFGQPTGNLAGRRLWDLTGVAGLIELLADARESDSVATASLRLGEGQGARDVQAKAHRFHANGRIGVVIVFEDVTELRRLERIRRDFVANVSHELKTPLTSIRGFVETLKEGALEDPGYNRRFLDKIEVNVERLRTLVSDLLSLARVEEQEGHLTLSRIDWRRLMESCLRRHDSHARGKDIHVSFVAAREPLHVTADEEALTQVVDNLVDNALKYTPAGGEVHLELAREGAHVVLVVRDTGIGIPEEDLERIFERFYRVDKARSRELGGTGLGLSIVKHLVQAMDGQVSVTSAVGRGTTFVVRLMAD